MIGVFNLIGSASKRIKTQEEPTIRDNQRQSKDTIVFGETREPERIDGFSKQLVVFMERERERKRQQLS